MRFFTFLLLAGFAACSLKSGFEKDRAMFEASPVKMTFRSVADMNDAYFEIRENHFFEFYRQLFDSVKNTRYPGRLTQQGDTLLLHFYNKEGEKMLGSRAIVDEKKNEIRFFR